MKGGLCLSKEAYVMLCVPYFPPCLGRKREEEGNLSWLSLQARGKRALSSQVCEIILLGSCLIKVSFFSGKS